MRVLLWFHKTTTGLARGPTGQFTAHGLGPGSNHYFLVSSLFRLKFYIKFWKIWSYKIFEQIKKWHMGAGAFLVLRVIYLTEIRLSWLKSGHIRSNRLIKKNKLPKKSVTEQSGFLWSIMWTFWKCNFFNFFKKLKN